MLARVQNTNLGAYGGTKQVWTGLGMGQGWVGNGSGIARNGSGMGWEWVG